MFSHCKRLENTNLALKEHACPSGRPSSLLVLGQCERLATLTGNALAGQQHGIISGGQGTHHGPGVLWSSALVCAHKNFDTASIVK
jgi:hypothetical protein